MNIFLHEFRSRLKSILIWSLSCAAMLFLFMSIFNGFSAQSAVLTEAMKNFPRELIVAFGMQNLDFANVLGYLGLIFLFVQVCLAVQAANYGFGLVSIEETEWTADFLLAKPVSRPRILTLKLLAALAALGITALVVWAVTFLVLAVFAPGEEYSLRSLFALLLSVPVFQWVFLSAGLFISLLVRRVRSVTPFSMGLVFGLYIINAFGGMIGEKSLEIITPFKHFEPNFILKNAAWDFPLVLLSLGIILLGIPASYLLYLKRNIPSAV